MITRSNKPAQDPESIKRKRELAAKIMGQGPLIAPRSTLDGLGNAFDSIMGGVATRRMNSDADAAQQAGQESASAAFGSILDAFNAKRTGGFPAAPNPGDSSSMATLPATDTASARVAQAHGGGSFNGDLRSGIIATAEAIGADPMDLATAISYETAGTFDPTKKGPRTQWGQHRGLIQFGEPQAKQHGVNWDDPIGSQLGPDGAIASYFKSSGFQPGMSGLDLYSTINAGAPGRYNRSDANNGGAPGTVQDKWEKQMAGHREKAMRLIGDYSPASAQAPQTESGLTPEALQQWAFSNYAPDVQNGAVDAVNALGASQPVGVAENPQDILAQEQAMMGQDPLAFQQPDMMMPSQGTQPRLQAPMAAAQQPMPQPMPQAAPPLPAPTMVPDMQVADVATGPQGMGAGTPGETRRGPDGRLYQYAQTSGMAGATGDWGWIPVADGGGGSADVARALTGATVNPDLPMAGNTSGLLPIARSLAGQGQPRQQSGGQPSMQQLAQASGFPEMAGNNPQAIPAPGPDIGMLLQAASNPWLSDQQRGIVNMMLEQQMQAQDPMRQLDMDYKRAQIGKLQADASGLGDAAKVQSSVVLDDGSTVMVMNNGQRRVLSPTGDEVTGQAAADAIRSAREYTVDNQREIYTGRREGTLGADIEFGGAAAGAKKGGEKTMEAGFSAWEDYGKLQSSIGNINEAIASIDSGAQSGVIYKMLPNVTEASASLQNAMDRMGLDVVGSVTFGALSEGELNLAMSVAVPRDLSPPELKKWLVRKRNAQQKASEMLANAAQYLTKPGNTINGWIDQNRAAKASASLPAEGGGQNKPVSEMSDEELEALVNGNR